MNKGRYVIGVNREYNYHPVFHGEIFSILEEQFTLHELPVINFSELLIRAPRGSFFQNRFFLAVNLRAKPIYCLAPIFC